MCCNSPKKPLSLKIIFQYTFSLLLDDKQSETGLKLVTYSRKTKDFSTKSQQAFRIKLCKLFINNVNKISQP